MLIKAIGLLTVSAVYAISLAAPASGQPLSGVAIRAVDSPSLPDATTALPRKKSIGKVAVPKTRPAVTIVMTSSAGRPIRLSTKSAKIRDVPAGQYSLTTISVPGHRVVVNGGQSIIRIRKNALVRIPVAVTRLASVRFESVTTDGVDTVARVMASKPVSVQVQFLDDSGRILFTRSTRLPGTGRPLAVTAAGIVATQVRARPLNAPGEKQWTAMATQVSLLETGRPDVSVEPGDVTIEAPLGGKVTAVSRVDLATGTVTRGISAATQDGSLAIQDAPPRAGNYEYQIAGEDRAGGQVVTTIAVSVPDASGDGRAVLAPNTRRIEVETIEFPTSGAGPVAIPLTALRGIEAASLIGNPVIAVERSGSNTAIGIVIRIDNDRIWIKQSGLHTVFQTLSESGFTASTPRFSRLPRSLGIKCSAAGLELAGPRVEFGVEGPTSDFTQWRGYTDGWDVHLEGSFRVKASLKLTGFEASRDLVKCYLDDVPMAAVVNINIPTPVGVIPTVLTAKPFVELDATIAVEFGTYTRSIILDTSFNVSDGFNGMKLHTANPFSVSGEEMPFELGSPSASVNVRGGFDFAYGFGQGTTAAGLQVAGLSLKAGPRVGVVFGTGLAAGEPDKAACVRGELAISSASIEGHLIEIWGGGSNSSLGDVTLFQLPEWSLPSVSLKCWGVPPLGPDDAIDGDFDADGIRDKMTFGHFETPSGHWGRLSVTASSTGVTSSIDIGSPDSNWYLDDSPKTQPIDGRAGVEAVIWGVMGANNTFVYFVTWRDGKLEFVSVPGGKGSQWSPLHRWFGFDYHLRRLDQGRVIVTNITGFPRTDTSSRKDEELTITQYEWTERGWIKLSRKILRYPYPQEISKNFDASPYGEPIT